MGAMAEGSFGGGAIRGGLVSGGKKVDQRGRVPIGGYRGARSKRVETRIVLLEGMKKRGEKKGNIS